MCLNFRRSAIRGSSVGPTIRERPGTEAGPNIYRGRGVSVTPVNMTGFMFISDLTHVTRNRGTVFEVAR